MEWRLAFYILLAIYIPGQRLPSRIFSPSYENRSAHRIRHTDPPYPPVEG
jgi:Lon protease-like protein